MSQYRALSSALGYAFNSSQKAGSERLQKIRHNVLQKSLLEDVIVNYNGSLFKVTDSLICLLDVLSRNTSAPQIILDIHDVPVFISNLDELLQLIIKERTNALQSYKDNFVDLFLNKSLT